MEAKKGKYMISAGAGYEYEFKYRVQSIHFALSIFFSTDLGITFTIKIIETK
jgi:hypothetical protein